MSLRAVARQHGNRGAARTRFPSVNALSEFSHNQGQFADLKETLNKLQFWSPATAGADAPCAWPDQVVVGIAALAIVSGEFFISTCTVTDCAGAPIRKRANLRTFGVEICSR